MRQSVEIPWGMWQECPLHRLEFPTEWTISVCPMVGAPALAQARIDECLLHPQGHSWQDVASGARSACIAVDDLARPTPASRILPTLCGELLQAGIARSTIIIATGCHRPLSRAEMVLKVGEGTLRTNRVINHNPHCGLEDLGRSSRGTPFQVNEVFCRADVKIVVGSVTPNYMAGFGGGAKLVLPGLAGCETTSANHSLTSGTEAGNLHHSIRADMEELARKVGVDVAVSCVLNENAEICDLYAGDVKRTHEEAVAKALLVYSTPTQGPADILILNAFPKDSDLTQIKNTFNPMFSTQSRLIKPGGTIVILSAAWDGIGFHAIYGNPEELVREHLRSMVEYAGTHLILYTPRTDAYDLSSEEGIEVRTRWEEVLSFLRERYGVGAQVRVFPQAALQLCR